MSKYTITLTAEERSMVLHCIGRVEAIVSINYESTADEEKKQKYKEDSKHLVALWYKIKKITPTK